MSRGSGYCAFCGEDFGDFFNYCQHLCLQSLNGVKMDQQKELDKVFKKEKEEQIEFIKTGVISPKIEKYHTEKKEMVEHPSHYNSGKIEVIDFIEDQKLDFNLGNCIKYLARAGKKDPKTELQDMKKALWYLNRKIEQLEKK